MFGLTRTTHCTVFDCLTGSITRVDRLPFEIGAGDGVDLRVTGPDLPERICVLRRTKDHGLCLIVSQPDAPLVVNGASVEAIEIRRGEDYSLVIGNRLLAVHGGRANKDWDCHLNHREWVLFDDGSEPRMGPLSPEDLMRETTVRAIHGGAIVMPRGLKMGFYLAHFQTAMRGINGSAVTSAAPYSWVDVDAPSPDNADWDADRPGTFSCPVCWLRFETGQILHVAEHESLRGDPLLGEDAPQRFLATRFDALGHALDAMGLPCTDTACPHCRHVLPPEFTQIPAHLISIVGDQSAGKSYYLSVLVKLLPMRLYDRFGVVFQDADPGGNAPLNEMKRTLFSATTPDEARLVKTQLEGVMYVRLPRFGRTVGLPRPFSYSVSATRDPRERCLMIFYDNAGEQFQPGRDSADSPGARHVASSGGILFLFDPFNSNEFRAQMGELADPQLERSARDEQDVILSELKVRIKRLCRVPAHELVATPLAMVIGKCDAWGHLLGPEPMLDPVMDGRLDQDAVDRNSDRVRSLVRRIAPALVANVEEISSRVRYFAASSFGHAPVKMGTGDYVPDPRRLKPIMAEVPPLWLLSKIQPALVPS